MLVWKRKYRFLIRGISLMLAFSFLPPSGMKEIPSLHAATAAVTATPEKDFESALSSFVSVSEIFIPGEKDASMETFLTDPKQKMVFYLEDAHGNLSAQKNTVQALRVLSERGGLKEPWIALEGSGTEEIDHRVLSAFPDQTTRERLTEYLSLQGKLNAADSFAALYNPKARLFGVDSEDLAEENRQSYRNSLSEKEEAEALLQKLERINVLLKEKIYEGNLAWLDKASTRFEKDPDYFFTYLNLLQEETKKYKVPFENYPHVAELLELKKMESRNQTGEAAREMELLKQERGLADFNDEAALQLWNRDKTLFAGFPHLQNHVQMLERYHNLKVTSLWEELDRWTEALWEKLLFYPEAREAHAVDRTVRFYKKLLTFSVLPNEYSLYLKNPEAYSPAGLKSKIKQFHFLLKPEGLDFKNPDPKRFDQLLQAPLHFYASARERNAPLLDHLIRLTDQSPQGKVFFIAGGFHRNEIIRDLKAKGLSYAVLTPKISSEEGQENYWKLLGGAQTDLETSLAGLSAVALKDTFAQPAARRSVMILARAFYEASAQPDPQVLRTYEQNLAPGDLSVLKLVPVTSAGRGMAQVGIPLPEGLRRFLIHFNPGAGESALEIPGEFALSETVSLHTGNFAVYAEPQSQIFVRSEARASLIETEAFGLGEEANDTARIKAFLENLTQSIIRKTEEKMPGLLDRGKLQGLFEKLFFLSDYQSSAGAGERTDDFIRPPKSALISADFVRRLGDRKVRIAFGEVPQLVTFEEKPPSPGQEAEQVLHIDWATLVRLGDKKMKIAEMFLTHQLYGEVFEKLVHPEDTAENHLSRDTEMAQSLFTESESVEIAGKPKSLVTPLGKFIGVLREGASSEPSGAWKSLYARLMKHAPLIEGKYLLTRELGSGGFSTVYKALDTDIGKFVAVKKINKIDMTSPNKRRVEREIDAMVQMDAKNSSFFPKLLERIPKLPPGTQTEFVPPEYLVMEYVRGKPLNEWFPKPDQAPDNKNHLNSREMIDAAIQVLQALQDLHVRNHDGYGGFLHRDIKPNNIMLHREDSGKISVKLIDLGLAKELKEHLKDSDLQEEGEDLLRTKHDQTSVNALIGTPLYMSPEQAMGVRFLAEASDIYSFGLTLIEMVTGLVMMRPNPNEAPTRGGLEFYDRHLNPNYHDLSSFKGKMDEELLRLLEKMIGLTYEKQPKEETDLILKEVQKNLISRDAQLGVIRYPNAEEPLRLLQEYLHLHPNPVLPIFKLSAASPGALTAELSDGKPAISTPVVQAASTAEGVKMPEPAVSGLPAKGGFPFKTLLGAFIAAGIIAAVVYFMFFSGTPVPQPPVENPPIVIPPVKDPVKDPAKDGRKDPVKGKDKIKDSPPIKDKKEEKPSIPAPKMETIEIWNGQSLRKVKADIFAGLELASGANPHVSKDDKGIPFFTEFTIRHIVFSKEISMNKETGFKLTVKIHRSHKAGLVEVGFLEPRKEKTGKDLFSAIRFDPKGARRYEQIPVRFGVPPKDAPKAWKEFEADLEKKKETVPGSEKFSDGWTDLTFERLQGEDTVRVFVGGQLITSFKLGDSKMTVHVLSPGSSPQRSIDTMPWRIGPIELQVPEETNKGATDLKRSELRNALLLMPGDDPQIIQSFIDSTRYVQRPKTVFLFSDREALKRAEARYGPLGKVYGFRFVKIPIPADRLEPGTMEWTNVLMRAAGALGIPVGKLEWIVLGGRAPDTQRKPVPPASGKTNAETYRMPFQENRFTKEPAYPIAYFDLMAALLRGQLDRYGVVSKEGWIDLPESLVKNITAKLQAQLAQERSA